MVCVGTGLEGDDLMEFLVFWADDFSQVEPEGIEILI